MKIKLGISLFSLPLLALAVDPLAENSYLLNKGQVLADAKADCSEQVDLIVRTAPKALKESKGEKNVRDRALVGCVYSLGSVAGEDLTRKSLGRTSDISNQAAKPNDLDEVQLLHAAMTQCAADALKSGSKGNAQFDTMLYCIFLRGAEAGRDFALKTKQVR